MAACFLAAEAGVKYDQQKSHGIHYTPPGLADFLASVTFRHIRKKSGSLEVLDPCCGGGSLLQALFQAVPKRLQTRLTLCGFETAGDALAKARESLSDCRAKSVRLEQVDFLSLEGIDSTHLDGGQRTPSASDHSEHLGRFDAVIANPPYVRTQVLGAQKAQQLAQRFGLTGRVDLYHAFVKAMVNVLKPGGVLGLLTSNRFLTVKSGAALRRLLRTEFDLQEIYDLGDTRLFDAAVLPVILVARKGRLPDRRSCTFDRVYACRTNGAAVKVEHRCDAILDAVLDRGMSGIVATARGTYKVERGTLAASQDGRVWSLSTPQHDAWLRAVKACQVHTFDELGRIRVGIKTCADRVFIRKQWDSLPPKQQPERDLLHPLVTHFIADRWRPAERPGAVRVLYPHTTRDGKRIPIVLSKHPRAANYLRAHRQRLEARKYVVESGRKWYEIWVPHNPADWKEPKLVFPDIAEAPRFFFDDTGAIVNGDCYWITLRRGVENKWLLLMLAVANSSFITKYYDIVFHNKLYAGRRRFMTQYVKEFPLPNPESATGQRIIELAGQLVQGRAGGEVEAEANALVWEAFGLVEEGRAR